MYCVVGRASIVVLRASLLLCDARCLSLFGVRLLLLFGARFCCSTRVYFVVGHAFILCLDARVLFL